MLEAHYHQAYIPTYLPYVPTIIFTYVGEAKSPLMTDGGMSVAARRRSTINESESQQPININSK